MNEIEYISLLFTQVYGIKPKAVFPSQLCLPVSTTMKKYFFLVSYVSDAGGYISLSCKGTTVNTLIGSTSGIDGVMFSLFDEISTTGANILTGYEIAI